MPRALTLVARSQDGSHVLPDGNDFLRQVWSAQRALQEQRPDEFAVRAVTCVNEIRPLVQDAAGEGPIALQLVGHGRPGELELSCSWHRRYRDELRFYMLDNNSRELAMLGGCRGALAEIRLIACDVGAEPGHPLLFTLSKLLDCDVLAALGPVASAMFDTVTGLFCGAMTKCARQTQQFSVVDR